MMPYAVGSPFPCVSCNRLLVFQSVETALLICPYCRELIEKQEISHQHCQVPPIPEDVTLIQIGTRGNIAIEAFEVIGRIRLQFKDGYLNLWTLSTEQNALRWLAESFGQYYFCQGAFVTTLYEKLLGEEVGESIELTPAHRLTIDHIQECIDWDREGELPAFGNEMRYSLHFELSNPSGECVFAWHSKSSDAAILVGRKYNFEYFNFTNLRPLNEWL